MRDDQNQAGSGFNRREFLKGSSAAVAVTTTVAAATESLAEDNKKVDRVVRQDSLYCLVDDELYRKRECRVKLRCIPREQGQALLADIHEGTCANHVASRAQAGKAFRQGFYWLTALADTEDLVRSCAAC